MAQLAVLYSSLWGQTRKISQRIAERLREAGHSVELHDARHPPSPEALARLDGVVVGSWVRGGRHMSAVRRFVRRNRALLTRLPSAFFSVSLLQLSSRRGSRERAQGYLPRFFVETGWHPELTAEFAGALSFARFGWLGKRLMRLVWRREGFAIDYTRDREYTNWDDVDRFAAELGAQLSPVASPRHNDGDRRPAARV